MDIGDVKAKVEFTVDTETLARLQEIAKAAKTLQDLIAAFKGGIILKTRKATHYSDLEIAHRYARLKGAMEERRIMDDKIKEILERQLKLLAEYSERRVTTPSDFAAITNAMNSLAHTLASCASPSAIPGMIWLDDP